MTKKANKNLLIKGGRVIDPGLGMDETASLLVSEGVITWLGSAGAKPPLPDYDILDAAGLIICPGLIDLHCHLREPGFPEQETIASGSRAAARGGFTTICAMPNTNPPPDSPPQINYINETARKEGAVRVLAIGCISRERKGLKLADIEGMAQTGAIAISDDGSPILDAELMRQALELSSRLGIPVIDHCEDTKLTEGGVMNEGQISARLGLKGMPASAEESLVARDLELARQTGGHLHLAHVSTAGSVELIRRAKENGTPVTAEVTPHHLTLTEESVANLNPNAKVNPPLRTARDAAALLKGLKEGVIDIIATDHAPHTAAAKRRGFELAPFGISGLETALGSLLGLVHRGQLDLKTLISKLTLAPAEILGSRYGQLGALKVGAPADIVVINPDQEWVVDTEKFASKGKNTPLAGSKLKGRAVATIYGGKIVYRDESVRFNEAAIVKG